MPIIIIIFSMKITLNLHILFSCIQTHSVSLSLSLFLSIFLSFFLYACMCLIIFYEWVMYCYRVTLVVLFLWVAPFMVSLHGEWSAVTPTSPLLIAVPEPSTPGSAVKLEVEHKDVNSTLNKLVNGNKEIKRLNIYFGFLWINKVSWLHMLVCFCFLSLN